jgi:DNA-binding transcriptional LysR family regulator
MLTRYFHWTWSWSKWFEQQQVSPQIVGEFDDSALMKAFGQAGAGVFIAPTPISSEVKSSTKSR